MVCASTQHGSNLSEAHIQFETREYVGSHK
jgi:hypothetical protein